MPLQASGEGAVGGDEQLGRDAAAQLSAAEPPPDEAALVVGYIHGQRQPCRAGDLRGLSGLGLLGQVAPPRCELR